MFKLKALLLAIFISSLFGQVASASSGVLISQVKLGDNISARREFIEVYNNSDKDVEITNWCLEYITSGLYSYHLSCLSPIDVGTYLFLPAGKSALAVSDELASSLESPMIGDVSFSSRLSGLAGYVALLDSQNNKVDDLGWGVPDDTNNLIASPSDGLILSRKADSMGSLQDTDIYKDDFEAIQPKNQYLIGNIYEVKDLCLNLDDIQAVIPDGYEYSDEGCQPIVVDVCPNIDGAQADIPENFTLDDKGECVSADLCPNLDDIQSILPEGYIVMDGNCEKVFLPIDITEMMPNALGSDEGAEFVELYNPNLSIINLENYQLNINGKIYSISKNQLNIQPSQYRAFYNTDISFTLLNSATEIFIQSKNGTFTGDRIKYENPKEAESWAIINNLWQYTNQPTPGYENQISKIIEKTSEVSRLGTCAPGQYRNPETNRCRKIVTEDSSSLTPCQAGYERNPETNRCRKITSVSGDSTLKPCEPGYERNPETNRCRKITTNIIPPAGYSVEQTNDQSGSGVLATSVAGVGAFAVSYGVWEWRKDLGTPIKKVLGVLKIKH